MSSDIFFFSYPFFWIVLSAVFSGAGLSRITRTVRKDRDKEKEINKKWIIICLYFSISIIFAIFAIFIPGAGKIAYIKYIYLFLFFMIISFLGFRFKKSFGMPVLFLSFIMFLITVLFFQALNSYTGETEIAVVHVFSTKKNTIIMDLNLSDNRNEILEMKGAYFAPVVKVVVFHDLLVFFGVKTWYRFIGIVTYDTENGSEILSETDKFELQTGKDISGKLFGFFEKSDKYIPGIKSVQREITQKKAIERRSYSIRVQNDGGVEVIAE